MTKTQIQVPDDLLRELRALAEQREWSLAETFRRGAELLLQLYPRGTRKSSVPWTAPSSSRVGWKGLTADELREAVFSDSDPRLP